MKYLALIGAASAAAPCDHSAGGTCTDAAYDASTNDCSITNDPGCLVVAGSAGGVCTAVGDAAADGTEGVDAWCVETLPDDFATWCAANDY